VAKKRAWETTPEEHAAWLERHRGLEHLLERRLEQEGVTREQAIQRLREAK
jgi:hypothetical protein